MKIPAYILKTINQIEKHGFRLERLEKQLYGWLELYNIDTDSLDLELDSLIHAHNGSQLITELEGRLKSEEQVNVRTKKCNEREKHNKEKYDTID